MVMAGGGPVAAAPALPKAHNYDPAAFGAVEVKPLNRVQKISGPRLQAAWINIPHVTQFDESDITDLEALRGSLKEKAAAAGVKVTPLAFIIEAAVRAMREFPVLNSQLDESGQNLIFKKFFNVGFAADTPNGLLVPVIKGADKLDVFAVAKALGDLSGKARDGKLPGTDMQGAGFTISSLGGIGGTHVHAHHQFARSRHPRRFEVGDEAGVGWQAVRAAAHAAAVVLLRSPRHRWRDGRAHRQVPGGYARQRRRISSGRCREQDRPDGSRPRKFRRGRHHRRAGESRRQDRSGNATGHARNRQGHDGRAVHRGRHRDRSAGAEGRQDRQGWCDRAHRRHPGCRCRGACEVAGCRRTCRTSGCRSGSGRSPRAARCSRARTETVEAAQARRAARSRNPVVSAGRRSRRLHRRVPRCRPRPQGHAGRTLAHAGRRLPQRRLHSVQGVAARRQGHRRSR